LAWQEEGSIALNILITGATGFIGTAIVQELLNAGHQVLGLARSDASASALIAAGAEVHRGDLQDMQDVYRFILNREENSIDVRCVAVEQMAHFKREGCRSPEAAGNAPEIQQVM